VIENRYKRFGSGRGICAGGEEENGECKKKVRLYE
jgi:hypothetical protein